MSYVRRIPTERQETRDKTEFLLLLCVRKEGEDKKVTGGTQCETKCFPVLNRVSSELLSGRSWVRDTQIGQLSNELPMPCCLLIQERYV